MVNVKVFVCDTLAALHADTTVAGEDDFANPRPVGLHEKIPQAATATEGSLAAREFSAAHPAKPFPVNLAAWEAFAVGVAGDAAHFFFPLTYPHHGHVFSLWFVPQSGQDFGA